MNKNQAKGKRERTKEKIFNTAVALFLSQGYENTTVQEITEKADVAKGTFFTHFPTKDSILTYLGESRVKLIKEHLATEIVHFKTAREQIIKLFVLLAKSNEKDKEVTRLIAMERLKHLYSLNTEKSSNQVEMRNILVSVLTTGQQNGEFTKDFQPIQVADMLIGIYFFTMLQWLSDSNEFVSLEQEYCERVSIILGGISIGDSEK